MVHWYISSEPASTVVAFLRRLLEANINCKFDVREETPSWHGFFVLLSDYSSYLELQLKITWILLISSTSMTPLVPYSWLRKVIAPNLFLNPTLQFLVNSFHFIVLKMATSSTISFCFKQDSSCGLLLGLKLLIS